MDFTFSPEADEAAALAATILKDLTTPARLAEVEAAGNRFDPVLWRALGDAGLLTLTTPESHDGAGLGFLELCRVLVEAGRTVAPAPLAPDGVARLFVGEHGTDDQQRIAYSADVLSCAVAEEHEHAPTVPTTTAAQDGADFVLTGTKYLVPAATVATAFLVTATTPDGAGVFLVDADASGLQVRRAAPRATATSPDSSSSTAHAWRPTGASVPARPRLPSGWSTCSPSRPARSSSASPRVPSRSPPATPRPGSSSTGRSGRSRQCRSVSPTGTSTRACWPSPCGRRPGGSSERLPAAEAIATAKLWAADAGHRIAHTTVHVHGGVGIDLDGEAHRYFTAATRYDFEHGGATEQALRLGRLLAAGPA